MIEGQFLFYISGNNAILKNNQKQRIITMHLRTNSGHRSKQFSYQVQNSLLQGIQLSPWYYYNFFFSKDGYGMCDCTQHFDQIWPLETTSLGVTPGNKTLLWKLPEVAPRHCGSSNNTNRSRWNTALVGSLMSRYCFARSFMIKVRFWGHEVLFPAICCLPTYQLFPGCLMT